jgi:hypothetical protein
MKTLIAQYNKAVGYERIAKLKNGYKANRYGLLNRSGVVEQVMTTYKAKQFLTA